MRKRERGSVSPVFAMVLMVVILLLGAFLDREWLLYKIHLAENLADFAAESGARTAEVWDRIEVTKYQYWYVPEPVCHDPPACTQRGIKMRLESAVGSQIVEAKDDEIRSNWPALAGCGSNAEAPNWKCVNVRLVSRRVEYPAGTADLVAQVFQANWKDQPLARALSPRVEFVAQEGLVDFHIDIQISSVTGLMGWRHIIPLTGSAVTRIDPLELTLP
ncbi:MAG TPA: hypothetical protein VD973_27120 [Symbiobacteriaceae bacterium]|jgi:hypothetical protein|nr:hypothetical protein [Symbiobacteriaceae bacterium]